MDGLTLRMFKTQRNMLDGGRHVWNSKTRSFTCTHYHDQYFLIARKRRKLSREQSPGHSLALRPEIEIHMPGSECQNERSPHTASYAHRPRTPAVTASAMALANFLGRCAAAASESAG